MGWNSWNKSLHVDEALLRHMADAMVSSGMKGAAYEYLIIDDCWQISRDATGNIQADPKHFPSGMKAIWRLRAFQRLKFGIYSDVGEKTCAGRPGSQGHKYQYALQQTAAGRSSSSIEAKHPRAFQSIGLRSVIPLI